jgi:hypothetical protein
MTLAATRPLKLRGNATRTSSPNGTQIHLVLFVASIPIILSLRGMPTRCYSCTALKNFILRTGGFFCPDCPKLFPRTPPPAPAPSPAPGAKRAASRMSVSKLRRMVTDERRARSRTRRTSGGKKIRGRWTASCMCPSCYTDCILNGAISGGEETVQWWWFCVQRGLRC